MAEIVTYTIRELRIQRAATRARIKGLELHMLDTSSAEAELDRINWLLEERDTDA